MHPQYPPPITSADTRAPQLNVTPVIFPNITNENVGKHSQGSLCNLTSLLADFRVGQKEGSGKKNTSDICLLDQSWPDSERALWHRIIYKNPRPSKGSFPLKRCTVGNVQCSRRSYIKGNDSLTIGHYCKQLLSIMSKQPLIWFDRGARALLKSHSLHKEQWAACCVRSRWKHT